MSKRIGLDDFILECWGIDSSGWTFKLVTDMWWEIKAVSEKLGAFRAVSLDPSQGIEETLGDLLGQIGKENEKNGVNN